jgi:pimeloyl-ACP methyl ester carboxylesterase
VLDNVTLYWLTNTGVSSARLYWENKLPFFAPVGVKVPVAVSAFPDELYTTPRSWAERAFPNLIHYNRLDKGGHFAAWEQPMLLTSELRARSGHCATKSRSAGARPPRRHGQLAVRAATLPPPPRIHHRRRERYDGPERRLSRAPVTAVPTVTIASDFDGAAASGRGYAKWFSGWYAHRILDGIGHNVPQEAPRAFADAVIDVDRG